MMKEVVFAFQKSLELVLYSGWTEAALGIIYVLQGEKEKAENLLKELIEREKKMFFSSICIGLLAYDLNRSDMAFEYFEKAFEERGILMPFLNVFTEYDKIRQEPRFQALLEKMGLQ